jgi:hypothetical protein
MHTQQTTIYEDDFQRLGYAPDHNYMIYVAQGLPPSSEYMRLGLRKVLEMSQHTRRPRQGFLADLRQAQMPTLPDAIWLNEVFLPQFLSPEVRKMAWVLSAQFIPRIALDYMVNKVVPPTCELNFFDNPEDARAWLDDNSNDFL